MLELKPIFARTDFGEHLCIACVRHAKRSPQAFAAWPKKGVGSALKTNACRHGRLSASTHCIYVLRAATQIWIVRVDRPRKSGIRLGVFMCAVDSRLVWEGEELLKAGPHLTRRPFKEAATAEREERIAHERHVLIFKVVGNVATRVPRHIKYGCAISTKLIRVAIAKRYVYARNAFDVGGRTNNSAVPLLLELEIASGVVKVVMGIENVGQFPSSIGERAIDRSRIRRIDCPGQPGLGIVNEKPIVVRQARDLNDLQGHEQLLTALGC